MSGIARCVTFTIGRARVDIHRGFIAAPLWIHCGLHRGPQGARADRVVRLEKRQMCRWRSAKSDSAVDFYAERIDACDALGHDDTVTSW